ncbi:GerAB/ArcD/ProY family transporter [Anaeromicrobium sediminis]|uniref:Uncharacterized protein n=1 Tax=Anaeromicrobium sediminis TaxID=1478221 RepID=A0A267MA78_9FIRM|nr:GerAB/ArcD/ProY family transporter [Anaeromicrobium sediminis]PAB56347.1 hypothetical protein CCE28_20845 [Anaeromicrobium sediminis]
MEKSKINIRQLFSLMVLFEIGSAIVVGLGMKAKQDAWLAIILGMVSGLLLFLIYGYIFYQYPNLPLTSCIQKILGRYLGTLLAFSYILYFIYIASRVLRDFGELIVTTTLDGTPLIIVNLLIILVVAYGSYLGLEVLARAGEILFMFMIVLVLLFVSFLFISNLPKIENLQPFLQDGLKPVLTTVFPLTLTFPFGEMIVFNMFLPYLNKPKEGIKTGLHAMILSGILLSAVIALNISVLGVHNAANATFPSYKSIQKINIGNFIQRLDIIGIITLIIGGFFKIGIFSYGAVIGLADLFKVKKHDKLVYAVSIVVFIGSIQIANNFSEHIEIGLDKVPTYVHIPLQVVVPLLLLFVILIRKG